MSNLVTATVKFPAREPTQTTRGPRINVKVTLPSGEDVQVWGDPSSPIAAWTKGQTVTLKQNGKYFDPVTDGSAPQQAVQAPQKAIADVSSPEGLEALQKRADALTALYIGIYHKLIEGDEGKPFDGGIHKEDLASAAATIFIQVCRG